MELVEESVRESMASAFQSRQGLRRVSIRSPASFFRPGRSVYSYLIRRPSHRCVRGGSAPGVPLRSAPLTQPVSRRVFTPSLPALSQTPAERMQSITGGRRVLPWDRGANLHAADRGGYL